MWHARTVTFCLPYHRVRALHAFPCLTYVVDCRTKYVVWAPFSFNHEPQLVACSSLTSQPTSLLTNESHAAQYALFTRFPSQNTAGRFSGRGSSKSLCLRVRGLSTPERNGPSTGGRRPLHRSWPFIWHIPATIVHRLGVMNRRKSAQIDGKP